MNHLIAIHGVSRLVFDAVEQATRIVEGMHANIAAAPPPFGRGTNGSARGIAGMVYGGIQLVNGAVRAALDPPLRLLAQLPSDPAGPSLPEPQCDAVRSAVNGVLGDHLVATDNPLAIPMRLRRAGQPLSLENDRLALPEATAKVLVLVHGLCMSDAQWKRRGHDHGEALARDLGYTAVYLHYNSGRHVSENGREFARLVEALLDRWPVPVEELTIIAHSGGGLVSRSACHYAKEAGAHWPSHLRAVVFLGTPHHGAPLERGGNSLQTLAGLSPYTAPLARLGMIRSAGVTDLRYGNLLDEDWQGGDRFASVDDRRRFVPLPQHATCYAVAATTGERGGDLKDRLFGDGLVPVASALGQHADPQRTLPFLESHRWIGYGLNHFDLLDRSEVYARVAAWLC
jgi:hypothetical protein